MHPIQAALRTLDGGLEGLSRVSEAIDKSFNPLPTSDTYDASVPSSLPSKIIEGVRSQVQRGLPIPHPDVAYVESLIDGVRAKEGWSTGIDDRKQGLEEVLTLLSRLPAEHSKGLTHAAIRQLYYDLPHPPATHVGKKYAFRTADGSGNNLSDPNIGKAGTPYSRTCVSMHPQPRHALPDPGLIFDALLKRDKFVPHPGGLSSLFFHFATNVIHTVFRTSRNDYTINETSSYADLAPLYGNNQEQQDTVRHKTGRGKLYEDVFCETRLLRLPPQVGIIMVMFCRNHNYIADKLLEINERGTWLDPPPADYTEKFNQDDEIFNTARLINCGTFANVIMGDFLAAIMGTVRDGSSWTLDILNEYRESDGTLLERGRGNSCSVEFNVLYRFHQCMAPADEEFINNSFSYLFPGQSADEITVTEFEKKLSSMTTAAQVKNLSTGRPQAPPSPRLTPGSPSASPRPFVAKTNGYPFEEKPKTRAELEYEARDDSQPVDPRVLSIRGSNGRPLARDRDGRYNDAELARYLMDATAEPAGAFRARGVPEMMRVIEILGIEQSRTWGCCTLNEFRKFLGLRPYESFEEWNPDQEIANAARSLYRHPDNLELYVGLAAEAPKPVGDGAGLCPSYTTSRALLADAITLVRGDRHFTTDFTPYNLTTWGFAECSRNTKNAGWGGMLGKVFARALPTEYDAESVYTHFPLMTPASMTATLTKLGKLDDYSLERPLAGGLPIKIVNSSKIATRALVEPSIKLSAPHITRVREILEGPGYWTSADTTSLHSAGGLALVRDAILAQRPKEPTEYFYQRTVGLINARSYSVSSKSTRMVDLVQDIVRFVPLRWAAFEVGGLPLKITSASSGIFYEQQLYQMLEDVYSFVYLEPEPTLQIPRREAAKESADRLLRFIKLLLQQAKGGITAGLVGSVLDYFIRDGLEGAEALAKRLVQSNQSIDTLANDLLAIVVTASVELPQIFTHVINFYLQPENSAHAERIRTLAAASDSEDTIPWLAAYAREALRFDPVTPGLYRAASQNGEIRNQSESLSYVAGETLFISLKNIGLDPTLFSEPESVDPSREADYSVIESDGIFKLMGPEFTYKAAAQVMCAVFGLNNVRQAEPNGLARFAVDVHGTDQYFYQDAAQRLTPWANRFIIAYDI